MFEGSHEEPSSKYRTGYRRCFCRLSAMWTTDVNRAKTLYWRDFKPSVMKIEDFGDRPLQIVQPAIADVFYRLSPMFELLIHKTSRAPGYRR